MNRNSLTLLFTLAMFLPLGILLFVERPQVQMESLEGGVISFAIVILVLRVAARAVVRDVFSSMVKVAFRSFTRIFLSDITEGTIHREPKIWEKDNVSFTISWLVLGSSLLGVYYLQTGALQLLIFPALVLPFGLYTLAQKAFAKTFGAAHNLRLYIDGLLLQAYFTGARSFLPIAHESEISGEKKTCAMVVVCSNLALFILIGGLYLTAGSGLWVDSALLFAIVGTFPLRPMDGWYVWNWNRGVSILLFVLSLASFAYMRGTFAGAIL